MIYIDVRTKGEYELEHLKGALLWDIMDMMQGHFPAIDKKEEITLYCESGNRSMMAKALMEKAGFQNITDGGSIELFRRSDLLQ